MIGVFAASDHTSRRMYRHQHYSTWESIRRVQSLRRRQPANVSRQGRSQNSGMGTKERICGNSSPHRGPGAKPLWGSGAQPQKPEITVKNKTEKRKKTAENAQIMKCSCVSILHFTRLEQEGQHPLTGERAANFRLMANQ